jgi:hypothetical protein
MSIATRQNEQQMLRLQRARRALYGQVKKYQGVVVAFTLLFPVLSAVAAVKLPMFRPYLTVLALAFSIADVAFFDRWAKRKMKEGARLQEEFDCHVFTLPWNNFVAGSKIDVEDVARLVRIPLPDEVVESLVNWYPCATAEIPLAAGRIACQRSNVRYDASMRRVFGTVLQMTMGLLVLGVLFSALFLNIGWPAFVLTELAPGTPLFIWLLREYNRQADAVVLVNRLKDETEKLWAEVQAGSAEASLDSRSRQLQDAIFAHRGSSPLVFDWLYGFLRKSLEADMTEGVDVWVQRYQNARSTCA